MKRKAELIKCPVCGAEYLPAEIYLPNHFLGRPEDIERNNAHRVLNFYGESMNTVEHYCCDQCHSPFKVTARVQFITEEELDINFNEDYTTTLKSKSLFLKED